jgi:hypothetical protein
MTADECSFTAIKADYGIGYEAWITSGSENVVPT